MGKTKNKFYLTTFSNLELFCTFDFINFKNSETSLFKTLLGSKMRSEY